LEPIDKNESSDHRDHPDLVDSSSPGFMACATGMAPSSRTPDRGATDVGALCG
jgi:hypothetical protein